MKLTAELSQTLQRRYLASTRGELAGRVGEALARNEHEARLWTDMMARGRFWPAGNTLLAGTTEAVRPNCCVLPPVTDDNLGETLARAEPLWRNRIGIGFDLGGCRDPVAVLRLLSERNAAIPLGHRPQRGNMAVVPLGSPAGRAFAVCKRSAESATAFYNFNISLTVSSEAEWRDNLGVLREAAVAAHGCGDPGVVFLDTIRSHVPYNYGAVSRRYGPLSTVVPCGEQSMHPNETCTLGAVNLAADAHWQYRNSHWELDEAALYETTTEALRLLDATLDVMDYAGDEALARTSAELRRIGLGVMGWADVVAGCLKSEGGVPPFATSPALSMAHRIGRIYRDAALERLLLGQHITTTCIQPTGGISLLTGSRGFGIEPFFEDAHRLTPRDHVKTAAVWQQYVDNAVSKTVNLSRDRTPRDIVDVFQWARDAKMSLVSVYRDGSRRQQPFVADCPRGVSCVN